MCKPGQPCPQPSASTAFDKDIVDATKAQFEALTHEFLTTDEDLRVIVAACKKNGGNVRYLGDDHDPSYVAVGSPAGILSLSALRWGPDHWSVKAYPGLIDANFKYEVGK